MGIAVFINFDYCHYFYFNIILWCQQEYIMRAYFHVILSVISFAIISCVQSNEQRSDIVRQLLGKEVKYPDYLTYQICDTPIDYDFEDADFKIVTYLDSTGCCPCRMKLSEWNDFINELKETSENQVNFMMIINSTMTDEIQRELNINGFKHPIAFDEKNDFGALNQMPTDITMQTFLLDSENKILAVGNPVLNPNIKKLYLKKIFNTNTDKHISNHRVCGHPSVPLGVMSIEDSIRVSVELINRDSITLNMEDIIPSCDCLEVITSCRSLAQGQKASVDVKITPTQQGIYHQYLNIFFQGIENPETITFHGYVK